MCNVKTVDLLTEFNDQIRIFRTDLLTLKCCGNKQFKLISNLQKLRQQGAGRVLSFGGLWSNHLHAFALACQAQNLQAVAVVRGEPLSGSLLLDDAVDHGLEVHYVSRAEYRLRYEQSYVEELLTKFRCDGWLPEGGSNRQAVQSCAEITALLNRCHERPPANLVLAVGTGATMAGIVNGAVDGQCVTGVPVVVDDRLQASVKRWVAADAPATWRLLPPAYPTRYAHTDLALLEFVLKVYDDTGVILDPVYNGKALLSLLKQNSVVHGAGDCVFIHTGGLGGCLGFADKLMSVDAHIAAKLLAEVAGLLDLTI